MSGCPYVKKLPSCLNWDIEKRHSPLNDAKDGGKPVKSQSQAENLKEERVMKKGTIVGFIAGVVVSSSVSGIAGTSYNWYKKLAKKQNIGIVREYYTEDITAKMMRKRGNSIIVEKQIGRVINKQKDGELLNGGGYITYKHVAGVKKGDIVLTVLVHAPGKEEDGNVIARVDSILNR